MHHEHLYPAPDDRAVLLHDNHARAFWIEMRPDSLSLSASQPRPLLRWENSRDQASLFTDARYRYTIVLGVLLA